MSLSPILRRPGVAIALILALVGISVWINWPRPTPVDLPRLEAQEIAALTDSAEDRQRLMVHLTSLLYRRGGALAPWTDLPAAARPLWSTFLFETRVQGGLAALQQPVEPGTPSPSDAIDGYQTLGLPALADALRATLPAMCDPDHPPTPEQSKAFQRGYFQGIARVPALRLAWIRAHTDEIARPH